MSDGTKEKKTLIFSFDGTGNEPSDAGEFQEDESISNILKLHVLMGGGLHVDKTETRAPSGNLQVTHYYNGIGTREDGLSIPLLGKLYAWGQKFVNQAFAPKFGDARRILREAVNDFNETQYGPDDTLAIFGFSRGAALARKFASMILAEHSDCRVSFLGVFDTVAALGGMHRKGERIHSDVLFEHGTLNERIEKAVHILSLDETRVSFEPTLINRDADNRNRILEVWFPGVHSDVGGGYWFDGLSDLSLKFMIKQCRWALGDKILIEEGDHATVCKLLRSQGSDLALEVDDVSINPLVHGTLHENSGVTTLPGQEPRHVRVNENDVPSKQAKDIPLLHYSVKERFDKVPGYRPPALRGAKFKLLLEDGQISEPLHGISKLREFQIPETTQNA